MTDPEGNEGGTVLRTGTTLRPAPPRDSASPGVAPSTASLSAARIESGVIVKQRYVLDQIIGSGAMAQSKLGFAFLTGAIP